jgi:hypothetical protein
MIQSVELRRQKIDGRARNRKHAAFAERISDRAGLEKLDSAARQAPIGQLTDVVQKG